MSSKRRPRVEFVIVGDELLTGRVADTNSCFLARRLVALGLVPGRSVVVGDDPDAIAREVGLAASRSDLVMVAGGLGPTPDDRTLEAVAGLVGLPLAEHPGTIRRIEARFCRHGYVMPGLARRQALVPRGARLLANPVGMVPGMVVEYQGAAIVLLPGVPAELEGIARGPLAAFLRRRFALLPGASDRIRTFGVPEAVIAARARRLLESAPGVVPAFYPSLSGVDIVLRSANRRSLRALRVSLVRMLGRAVYEVGERPMEQVLGELLRRRRLTLATAESCSGGRVGDRVTSVPGSSRYYAGGIVAYSNRAKTSLLGVRPTTLSRHGAVSGATVREMALGVCRTLGSDVGVAVSGIAGPGGGTEVKPVGLVYVAVAVGCRTRTRRHRFGGSRRMVKERAAMAAMDLCRLALTDRGRTR